MNLYDEGFYNESEAYRRQKIENINTYYKYRDILREIYFKGELIGDLNGKIFELKDKYKEITGINVIIRSYLVTITVSNDEYLDMAINDLKQVLVDFVKKFSYLSQEVTNDNVEAFINWVETSEIFDVCKVDGICQVIVSL